MSVMTAQAAMLFSAKNGISPAFRQMAGDAQKFGNAAQSGMKKASVSANLMKTALGAAAGILSVAAIANGFKSLVNEASKIEDSAAAFTPLMGSVKKANELVLALNETAATTPFQFEDIAAASKQLLPVMNGDIEKTIKTFRMLGDTAGGNAQKLDSITRGYTKVMLKGKVDMEALNMIADAGVPIYKELAASMGVSVEKMMDLSRKGLITSADLTKSFENMTSSGGIFFNGMQIASETFSGKISTLKDNIALTAAAIGMQLLPYIKQFVDLAIEASGKIQEWIKNNEALIKNTIDGFKTIIGFISTIVKTVKFLLPVIISIGIGVIILKAYEIQIWAVAVATKIWAAAQAVLNFVLNANPIGLIIIGIAALIGIIVLLVMHWKEVSAVLMVAWEWLKKNYDMFLLLLGPIGLVTNAIIGLVSRWGEVVAAFQAGGILGAIKQIGVIIFDSIIMPIQKVLSLISKIPGVGKFASGASDSLSNMRNNLVAPNAQTAQAEISGRARVDVNFANAPAGTTATQRRPRQAGNLDLSLAGAN